MCSIIYSFGCANASAFFSLACLNTALSLLAKHSFTGASAKLDELSIVASHSFAPLSTLALRVLLEIDGTEGVTGLSILAGINGSLMILKPASTLDAK